MKPSGEDLHCPPLPVEIWISIIECITDCRLLPRVWLNLRLVSRMFKAATESAFIARHLPHTSLSFVQFGRVFDIHDDSIQPTLNLEFNGVSDDSSRALFTVDKSADSYKSWRLSHSDDSTTVFDYTIQKWRQALEPYIAADSPTTICRPPHMLTMRGIVNDTGLPGIQVDYDQYQISVEWRPMLSLLLGEEEFMRLTSLSDNYSYPESSRVEQYRGAHRMVRQRTRLKRFRRLIKSHEFQPYESVVDEGGSKIGIITSAQRDRSSAWLEDNTIAPRPAQPGLN